MSIASRHGKLHLAADDAHAWRRREDLLTADVFGAYRYLPLQAALGPLLASAENAEGLRLAAWAESCGIAWSSLTVVWCAFWPTLAGREPDLIVVLGSSPEKAELAVLVEVKLNADQHFIDGRPQIAHYGRTFLDGEFEDECIDVALPVHRPVVFITKGRQKDVGALEQARAHLGEMHEARQSDVFWTSWHVAAAQADVLLTKQVRDGTPSHQRAIVEDLIDDLSDRGFHRPRAMRTFPLPALPPLDATTALRFPRRTRLRTARDRTFDQLRALALPNVDGALCLWRTR